MTSPFAHTPLLVGVGTQTQRLDDPREAREPLALMVGAALAAGQDAGSPDLLACVERISVPKGRWGYGDPGRLIAGAIGAASVVTTLADVGVLQQSLIANACRRIQEGETEVELVVGGEAGFRLLRSKVTSIPAPETEDGGTPDILLQPQADLRHEAERRAGLTMPIGLYAILETAYRSSRGLTSEGRRAEIAALYSRFSEIAANNPSAWRRDRIPPEMISETSERNPMQALPYTRLHASSWSVDQSAALLLCSEAMADLHGVPTARRVFPLASSESNTMVPLSARSEVASCPGARLVGRAALGHAGKTVTELDLFELYSCFPVAVSLFKDELAIEAGRDLTVTGGMTFAGGPYNNFVLQGTARMAELLRTGGDRSGVVASLSGIVTKQAACVWSTTRGREPFAHIDVSGEVARATPMKDVLPAFAGRGIVIGYTVIHQRDSEKQAVALLDVERDQRTVATSTESTIVSAFEGADVIDVVVEVDNGRIVEIVDSGRLPS